MTVSTDTGSRLPDGKAYAFPGWVVLVALGVCLALRLPALYAILTFPYDLLNAAEAAPVTAASRMLQGLSIYTGPHLRPFISEPYPPVFAGIVALVLPFFQVPILAGRWAGALLIVWLAVLAAVFVFRETRSRMLALAAATLPVVLLEEPCMSSHYHPFHLAIFCSAVATVRRYQGARGPWILLVIASSVCAGITRQTGLIIPVLCAVALWTRSRHDAMAVLAYSFTVIILFHGGLGFMTDGEYFRNSFLEARSNPLRADLFKNSFSYLARNVLPLLILCAVSRAVDGPFPPAARVLFILGVGWLCGSSITSAKIGSGVPHHIAGLLLLWASSLLIVFRAKGRFALAAAALMVVAAGARYSVPKGPSAADWRNGEILRRLIVETPGPVLSDRHMGLLLPEHTPEYDLARVWEMRRYLPHPITQLLKDLDEARYELIISSRIYDTEETRALIEKRYRPVGDISSMEPFFYRFQILRRIDDAGERRGPEAP
jgi:hypothetical protein